MSGKQVKIIIVEDHPIFRMGMKDIIDNESDMRVVGEAADVANALRLLQETKPDLAIIDLSLKGSNGIDLVKDIATRFQPTASLVLSMHDEALHAERCILAGAKGYIMKQEACENVITAIRQILAGRIHLSQNVMSHLLQSFQNSREGMGASPLERITDRELEIFRLIGQGLSAKQIAARLHISVKTIGTYRERIKEKLGLGSAGDLMRHAVIWAETGIFKEPRQ